MKNTNINSLISNSSKLDQTLALLCLKKDSSLFNFDIENDSNVFNHPAVFSYFNHPNEKKSINFNQLFIGVKGFDFQNNTVVSDDNGMVYLPRLGAFYTEFPNEEFEIIEENNKISLKKDNAILSYNLEENVLLYGSKIEMLSAFPELYYSEFQENYKGKLINANPHYKPRNSLPFINTALKLIEKYCPEFYDKLLLTTNLIFVHDNNKVLNYISFNSHGMIVLYMMDEHDEVYFIEELIHQGSHNIFNTLAFDKSTLFKVDVENLMIGKYINKPYDYRTIYSVIHGLISIANRVAGFDKLIFAKELSLRQKHEIYGRFADQFNRFYSLGFEYLNKDNVFTQEGNEYFSAIYETCNETLNKYKWIYDSFDMSWIDLDFRYNDFVKYNSIDSFRVSLDLFDEIQIERK